MAISPFEEISVLLSLQRLQGYTRSCYYRNNIEVDTSKVNDLAPSDQIKDYLLILGVI